MRVKGGAYGCMCNFGKTGDSYLVSYRDPNLKKTIDIFEHTSDYIRNFHADERSIIILTSKKLVEKILNFHK